MQQPENEICAFIVDTLRSAGELSGSSLGALIQSQFPESNLKAQHGGLKQFVLGHCADKVATKGSQGLDIIFGLQSTENEEPVLLRPRRSPPPRDIWQAFTNPNCASDLIVGGDGGVLYLGAGEPLPDGFVRVQAVSKEEYRIIARNFLNSVEKPLQDELQEAVLEDDFWPNFSRILRLNKSDGVLDEWLRWREQQLLDLLKNRLAEAVPPDSIPILIEYIQRGRNRTDPQESLKRNSRSGNGRQPEVVARKGRSKSLFDWTTDSTPKRARSHSELRSILHEAIDNIEEIELRRIWLPVGVILDAVNKRA